MLQIFSYGDGSPKVDINSLRIRISGATSDQIHGVALLGYEAEATISGLVDIETSGNGIAMIGTFGGSSKFEALGGGTVKAKESAVSISEGYSGSGAPGQRALFVNVELHGKNAILVTRSASSTVTLNGGSASGANVLSIRDFGYQETPTPQTQAFTLNALNDAKLNGNIVTESTEPISENDGNPTHALVQMTSGSTLTGAIMGGASWDDDTGDAAQRAYVVAPEEPLEPA